RGEGPAEPARHPVEHGDLSRIARRWSAWRRPYPAPPGHRPAGFYPPPPPGTLPSVTGRDPWRPAMNGTPTATLDPDHVEGHPIEVRRPRFDWDGKPAHWIPGDPMASHVGNALHLLFPTG